MYNTVVQHAAAVYLLGLVGVGQRDDHPDDVEVVEGSAGGEGAGQHSCLAPCHLDAALGHGDVQRPHTHCRGQRQREGQRGGQGSRENDRDRH